MTYREHLVPSALSAAVDAIWTLEAGAEFAGEAGQPIVPDGRSEIIVHFGDAFERIDDGVPARQATMLIAGQLERPLIVRPTGRTGVLGIRLRPEGAAALMRVPQHELVGRTEAADGVSQPLAQWLVEVRDTARSLDQAVACVARGLGRFLDPARIDPRVTAAVGLIDRHACGISVDEIARRVALTRRQLERLFGDRVGLPPKRLMSIRRLQRALVLLERAEGGQPITSTAFAGGYTDQAHFVRECRALAGTTPSDQLLRRAELTGLFLRR
jgi:AraC-like DNA-binding protein